MKKHTLVIYICFSWVWFVIGTSTTIVLAQGATGWNPLQRVPGYLDDTLPPTLIADQNKTVYAFASQWVGEDPPQKAIVYRRWSIAEGWTNPVDILLSDEGESQIGSAFLDQTGNIHLNFWISGAEGVNMYYSRAPATIAGRARAWSEPELIGEAALSPGSAAINGNDKGNLTVIFTGNRDGNGVYAIHSPDGGQSWSEPEPIFLTRNPKLVPFGLQMYMGQANQVHAVWNVVDSTGVDISLYYARLDVASQQWNEPVLLEERSEDSEFFGPSFPAIVDNGDDVVVMYNSGKSSTGGEVDAGRPVQKVRLSRNGGDTWNEPIEPFSSHLGRSGAHALVVDSNEIVHALFIQRIEPNTDGRYAPIGGVWHSEYRNGRWTEPDLFDLGEVSGHDLRAVISQGNVLLLTMREDPGAGEIGVLFSYTTLNAPELSVAPLPSPTSTPTVTPSPTLTQVMPTSTPLPGPLAGAGSNESSGYSGDPGNLLLFGLVPVIIVLAGIVFVNQLTRYRRG